MPENTPQVSTFKFDEAIAKAKFKSIRDFLGSFVGRSGYNPFVTLKKHLEPLEKAFNKGTRTKELFDAIVALKVTEPVAEGAEHNVKNPPKEHAAAGRVDEQLASQQAAVVSNQINPKI